MAEYKVTVTIALPSAHSDGVNFQCSLFFLLVPIAIDSPYPFQSHEFRRIELSHLFGKDVVVQFHVSTLDWVPNDGFGIRAHISGFA